SGARRSRCPVEMGRFVEIAAGDGDWLASERRDRVIGIASARRSRFCNRFVLGGDHASVLVWDLEQLIRLIRRIIKVEVEQPYTRAAGQYDVAASIERPSTERGGIVALLDVDAPDHLAERHTALLGTALLEKCDVAVGATDRFSNLGQLVSPIDL